MTEELEWQTRRERINKRLTAINPSWIIIKYRENMDISSLERHAVEEFPTANGPADYAFFVKGKLLGILEAKKVGVNPQNVLEQAKRYSKGSFHGVGNWEGYRVPFLYSSNGEIIWFLDVRDNKNIRRQISHFHTAEALEEFFNNDRKEGLKWLEDNPIDIERLRYYQKEAIEAVEKSLIQHKRAMLVAMATGTGKTYTTVAQIYRLLQSKVARRILFLVDRRALAAQAVREFSSFNTPRGNKFDQEYEVYSQRFYREDFDDDRPFNPKVLPNEYLTSALTDLRKKLAMNNFSEKELQKAHKLVYHKDLADIISMVKHAVKEEEPILTAEERVDKALKKVMSGKSFNEEQMNWLGLIRQHLITNLTIELADFQYAPIFERQGGRGKAERVFEGRLESFNPCQSLPRRVCAARPE